MSFKHISLLRPPAWNQDQEPFYHVLRNPHFCPQKTSIKDKELVAAARDLESRSSSILNQLLWVSGRCLDSSESVFLHQPDADFLKIYTKIFFLLKNGGL